LSDALSQHEALEKPLRTDRQHLFSLYARHYKAMLKAAIVSEHILLDPKQILDFASYLGIGYVL
jgi:hypothetical protein